MTSRPLALSTEELLSTTRAVRKRLDLTRPVEPEVIEACIELALQAPNGSNAQPWHFVVVRDEAKRCALADIYRRAFGIYRTLPFAAGSLFAEDPQRSRIQQRVMSSGEFLAEHLHEVPVHVIPCVEAGRVDSHPPPVQAALWGSILPATWSFMLAARSKGLGTSWTTLHLMFEEEAAELLGIPHAEVTQAALIPTAYSRGTNFGAAPRQPLTEVLHVDTW